MNLELFNADDERAVSPVIGVILMVAITVILAAVIGAFVLDLGSQQSSNVNAAVDFEEQDNGDLEVTLTDKGNSDEVKIQYDGSGSTVTLSSTGQTETISDGDITDSQTVTAVASTSDNENVIQQFDYDGT